MKRKIKTVGNVVTKWETYKKVCVSDVSSLGVVQITAAKCEKCEEDHFLHLCSKSWVTPTKCRNCGGTHPASYSKCSKVIEYLEKRDKFGKVPKKFKSNMVDG